MRKNCLPLQQTNFPPRLSGMLNAPTALDRLILRGKHESVTKSFSRVYPFDHEFFVYSTARLQDVSEGKFPSAPEEKHIRGNDGDH
jgi:hypothetical protein